MNGKDPEVAKHPGLKNIKERHTMKSLSQLSVQVKQNPVFRTEFQQLFPDKYRSKKNSLCPWHDDTRESLQINDTNAYCHTEKTTYSRIDLDSLASGRDYIQSVKFLAEKDGITPAIRTKSTWPDPIATYDYQDADGKLIYRTVKFPKDHNPPFIQQTPNGANGWKPKLPKDVPRVLYRLPELNAADPSETVIITEGEKDAETARCLGFVATTTPLGAGNWPPLQSNYNIQAPLKDRICWIVPDNDEAGRKHALDIAISLSGFASVVKVVNLPGLPEKGDLSDFVEQHGPDKTKAMILELAAKTPEFKPGDAPIVEATDGPKKPDGNTQYKRVQKILKDLHVRVFRDENRRFLAHVETPTETYFEPILSSTLRALITKAYGRSDYPRDDPIKAALYRLWDETDKSIELHKRALQLDNAIYISRHAKNGEMYAVTKGGYELTKQAPPDVHFSPDPKLLELPVAQDGGSISELWEFLPFADDNSKIICAVWPILAWLTKIQRRGLFIVGRDGSGKTTLARTIRYIFDPHSKPIATIEENQTDFVLKCAAHFVVIIDNIDKLPDALRGAFCQLITEGSFGRRKLFSDDDYVEHSLKGTFITTGKKLPSDESEVLDRGLLLTMPQRCGSYSIDRHWERLAQARPRILGTMLRALSKAMETVKEVELVHDQSDRWYDWMKWGCAVAEGLGISSTRFQEAVSEARGRVTADVVDSHPVLWPLKVWAADVYDSRQRQVTEIGPIKATEFYEAVRSVAERIGFGYEFPKSPSIFSREINKLQGMIQRMGIRLDHNKPTRTGSTWTLTIDGSNSEFNEFLESNQTTDVKAECLNASQCLHT